MAALCAASTVVIASPHADAPLIVAAFGLGHLSVTDWSTRRVPRDAVRWLALGIGVALVAQAFGSANWLPVGRAFLGGAIIAVALGVVWWLRPDALGFGDVKVTALATGCAAALSWRAAASTIFWTALAGVAVAFVLAVHAPRTARPWAGTIPFVPALSIGYVIGVST